MTAVVDYRSILLALQEHSAMAELLPAFDKPPPVQTSEEPMSLRARAYDKEQTARLHEDRGSIRHLPLPGDARYGMRHGAQEVNARMRQNIEEPDLGGNGVRNARLPAERPQVAPGNLQLQAIPARKADS